MLQTNNSKWLFFTVVLIISSSVNASTQSYREHLLNARAQLNQAILALERAERANDGSQRYSFDTIEGKRSIREVMEGVDHFMSAPLQPQLIPNQYSNKEGD
ncbi:hypothetical protein A1QO_00580 [Vibrio genomosp. F10 str. ZF-129]|uniref:Integrative conjugative element protein, RAQPRD family n=1 Tax=Vibrio genomosp. F10 str. ZF-129 TaxID=1187848 RepID=A0A1E5BGA1_9VIBR|nr:RAQPRD family integrative conjugative element protein [Vibrio genomosp. F10]OEE35287.1 hypothetical protein A1QO_00580 [Vibrio genomosp. F10 str. ZF-129]